MKGTEFDESAFFAAMSGSGARALLIGRRALIVLGLPLGTADYGFWLHIDDIDLFNRALEPFDLFPNRTAEEARARGRYVLENDEHVDVLVARSVPTVQGEPVVFDEVWERRNPVELEPGVTIHIPSLEDLIATKRYAARPRDIEDIRLLESLREDPE